jgi:tetratricopeptide (TPR) repeat protein
MTAKRPTLRDLIWAFRGARHLVKGRYDEALAEFDRAIELDPADASAIACRGQALQNMERYEEALGDFSRVIELNPEDAFAIARRGQ